MENINLQPEIEIPIDRPELHEAVVRDLIHSMGKDWTPYGIRMWIDMAYKRLGEEL